MSEVVHMENNAMRKITDAQCLDAAERALAEHMTMRPMTDEEKTQAAAKLRAMKGTRTGEARSIDHMSATPGNGQVNAEINQMNGMSANMAVKAKLEQDRINNDIELHAVAIESADFHAVRKELEDRVEFYRGLVGCRK